jgi:hypothetical protein
MGSPHPPLYFQIGVDITNKFGIIYYIKVENHFNLIQRRSIMTTKTTNYSKENEAQLMAEYKLEPTRSTVSSLANDLGKSEKSIIAKLVTMGIYQKAIKVTKSGKPMITKSELVSQIEAHFGLELPSLVKSTKADLQNLASNLN